MHEPYVKAYLIFWWERYEANGGWSDLLGSEDSLERAVDVAKAKKAMFGAASHWQVVYRDTGVMMASGEA